MSTSTSMQITRIAGVLMEVQQLLMLMLSRRNGLDTPAQITKLDVGNGSTKLKK